MNKIRLISPFISLLLITLLLSGSLGFTLIRHTCSSCGTNETIATLSGERVEDNCHCHHQADHRQPLNDDASGTCDGCCNQEERDMVHAHGTDEFLVSDDCCSHEAERVVTDELVRAEAQNVIIPYFLVAHIIAIIEPAPAGDFSHTSRELPCHHGRDLTNLLCRIQS